MGPIIRRGEKGGPNWPTPPHHNWPESMSGGTIS
jgi:hypothetical protein